MRLRISSLTLAMGVVVLCACPSPLNNQQGYMPEQPIAYSHALHAGLYEMDCQYCHTGAEKSRHAGVPPSSVCMNCHSQVRLDSAEVQKLADYVEKKQPIPWVRVHRLPDHAFFDHSSHVVAGGLTCQECHGPVETMVRVWQQETMSMGWCLDCHRKTVNEKKQAPVPLAWLPPGAKPVQRQLNPPTDCAACHR